MAASIGFMLLPISVSEYSTFGGITGKISRLTNPPLSNSRSCCVSILGVAPGISLLNSEKRNVLAVSFHNISDLYFPPIIPSVASTGQWVSCKAPLALLLQQECS